MAFVITEADIFKYLIKREDLEVSKIKDNVKQFLNRFKINIFNDQYFVLYQAIEYTSKYDIILTYDYLHQILLNNMDMLLKDKDKISLFEEENLTDVEYAEKLLDFCLTEFDLIEDTEIEDETALRANMEFYIKTWQKEKHSEIIRNQIQIVSEGLKVGNTLYEGSEGANAYYIKAYNTIRSITDGDMEYLSDNIDTTKDTAESITEKMNDEAVQDIITVFGINAIDDHYEFNRGETVTIQAGTGVGKTRVTTNLCYNALARGKNVLYISLEQKSTRIYPMVEARHILEKFGDFPDLDDKSIRTKNYSFDLENTVLEARRDIVENTEFGRLRIEGLALKADAVYNYMVQVWEEGFHFDIVVLDYFGLLGTGKVSGSRYEALTETVNMLKNECKSFKGKGFLGIYPNQLTKDDEEKIAKGDDNLTKNAGSESQYLARASDYIFTLYQDADLKILNKMVVYISKVRSGNIVKPKVTMKADLGKCFFLDTEDEVFDDDDY